MAIRPLETANLSEFFVEAIEEEEEEDELDEDWDEEEDEG
jgi:hypothetical protein